MKIFIHGNSGSPSHFKNIVEREDIVLTIPGHAGIKALANCDLSNLGKVIGEQIANHIVSREPYQIVAHSLGCNVTVHAMEYLIARGLELPEKLIFIAGPLLTTIDELGSLFTNEESGSIFTHLNPMRKSLERAIILNQLKNDGVNQFIEGFKNSDPEFRTRFIESIGKGEFLNELELVKSLSIPTHFILGSKDPFINKNHLLSQTAQGENIKFFLLEGVADYPHLENPNLMKKTLLALDQENFHDNTVEIMEHLTDQGY